MPEPKELTAAEAAEKVKADFAKATDDIKGIATEALGRAEKLEKLTESQKADADATLEKFNALGEQVKNLAQQVAEAADRGGQGGGEEVKSLGERFADSDQFKALREKAGQRGTASFAIDTSMEMERKAIITGATTDAAGSAGAMGQATRLPGVVQQPDRELRVRDLLGAGRMDGNALEYVREKGFTNNAAPTAEGAAKPQSDIQLELITTSAKVIAHHFKASRQVLDDNAQLQSYINGRALYGLAYVEDNQILNGDGTGQNLLGLNPQASPYSAEFAPAAETVIDKIRLAMLQAALAEYPVDGVVMHPTDWARVELTKDADGKYIVGDPSRVGQRRLWGAPVVVTQAQTVDTTLVGAFGMGAQLFDRWLARVELATENEDDFVKNLVTILAEERLALATFRPEGFVNVDLGFIV